MLVLTHHYYQHLLRTRIDWRALQLAVRSAYNLSRTQEITSSKTSLCVTINARTMASITNNNTRTTRSMSRNANQAVTAKDAPKAAAKGDKPTAQKGSRKRKSPDESNSSEQPVRTKKARETVAAATSAKNKKPKMSSGKLDSSTVDPNGDAAAAAAGGGGVGNVPAAIAAGVPPRDEGEDDALVPAVLSFSFQDARRHLIGVDGRFEELFARIRCRPFEELERVHPFRALAMSIMAQQISTTAARSINHKFRRLYDPLLPEKPGNSEFSQETSSFPTPSQVANTDLATLRTAGLSGRKAEYLQDLAKRFADGRLSTKKLLEADDEQLAQMLIEVRGIGRWTVDMFSMFSLRRPDILPVGDLGVQRGMLRWFLSLHSPLPQHGYSLSPEKLAATATVSGAATGAAKEKKAGEGQEDDVLPDLSSDKQFRNEDKEGQGQATVPRPATPDTSSVLPAPESTAVAATAVPPLTPTKKSPGSDDKKKASGFTPALPAYTPSVDNILAGGKKKANGNGASESLPPPPLPEGLTISVLKARLGGTKVKGALLTPAEMEALTESWRPYRSLGVYYMWSLEPPAK